MYLQWVGEWEQINFQYNDDEVCFVLDQQAYKLDFYSASSLKQVCE